ncbi:hypothetical protein [Pseudonocardia endophytica]|uniref:FhuF-like iron-sulfur protein n=1 Tax=Pseudonocardia endophytica TaxID=401976 RepID=A0A4R1HDK6_PSEEN|nr:hypothetical protein [Pseudonocardia endophytica]TCK20137.1 hypothetical protein EV378_4086 [Pseudonocardia endophytica]
MEVLADGHGLGDRFVAELGVPDEPGWIACGDLFGDRLPAVLDAVAARRGASSASVAASLLFEQFALRLASPVVAAWVRQGSVLDGRPSAVSALVDDGVLRRLAFAQPPVSGGDLQAVAASLRAGLEPAADTLARLTRVGQRTLRGAMANAVANTFLHLSWPEPDRARYVDDAAAVLAAVPGCTGTVGIEAVDVDGESWMYTDRNTCCLAFRTSVNRDREQHYCMTCPVVPRATIVEEFGRATASYRARHG